MVDRTPNLSVVVGSRAYGLAVEGSDTDIRGFYMADPRQFWGIAGEPKAVSGEGDTLHWELGDFLRHALKGNPNIMEVLWGPLTAMPDARTPLHVDDIGARILAARDLFTSKRVFKSLRGYASRIIHRFKDTPEPSPALWKDMAHAIRLTTMATDFLETAVLRVAVLDHDQGYLRQIRAGKISHAAVLREFEQRDARATAVCETSSLPDEADREPIEKLARELRRFHLLRLEMFGK